MKRRPGGEPAGQSWEIGAGPGVAPLLHGSEERAWRLRGSTLGLSRPVVMGVVNLTPDSFSDGGRYADPDEALRAAAAMVEAGARIIDVGGESTRPGAEPVPAAVELERVIPFVTRAAEALSVPVSIDTRKAVVARAALEEGASVVNDVSGLGHDPDMASAVAQSGAGLVLMHMRGTPETMARHARYRVPSVEVARELSTALVRAREAGIGDESIVLDPGLGFAKDAGQTLELLADLAPVLELGFPVLVGPSRKSFLGAILGVPPAERLPGTVAACVAAYLQGVRLFRVHDVGPVVRALEVTAALVDARRAGPGGGR